MRPKQENGVQKKEIKWRLTKNRRKIVMESKKSKTSGSKKKTKKKLKVTKKIIIICKICSRKEISKRK